MTCPNYYNEHDKFAAAWLRVLIQYGRIAPGVVDERSIEDIHPDELQGYAQCHFFAGIGVWSYALRRAGWPDDRPVWTGSCPCQPFSASGKGAGFADERHLWPAWFHLITTAKPDAVPVFGEQVASKDGLAWLDLVQTDMEAAGYAFGAVDLCAAGVGAPHIRQRSWFVAETLGDTSGAGLAQRISDGRVQQETVGTQSRETFERRGDAGGMADTGSARLPEQRRERDEPEGFTEAGVASGMADTDRDGCRSWGETTETAGHGSAFGSTCGDAGPRQPSPTNGLWRDADWLYCRDGKWRPVEPGTFPLAHGAPARVGPNGGISFPTIEGRTGRLKGYGNAINAEVAYTFISAFMETKHGL